MKPRCPYCGRWYRIRSHIEGWDKTCGQPECQVEHKLELNRQWWAREPECRRIRYEKVRNRRREEDYWKKYRAGRPDYIKRNREQTRERMRTLRARRKEEAEVVGEAEGHLEGLRGRLGPMFATPYPGGAKKAEKHGRTRAWSRMFATQENLLRTTDGVLRYLLAKERFATPVKADERPGGTV